MNMSQNLQRIIAFGEALNAKAAKEMRDSLGGDAAVSQMLLQKRKKKS
jgi:hypothetical protein